MTRGANKVGEIGTGSRIGRLAVRYGTPPFHSEPTKENTDESEKKKRERERGRKKKREANPPEGNRGRRAAERAPAAPCGE